ncbi:MAG: response regulator [Campylobacterota bacterium]|nr:response regulator [Campylobacterota bacterium]
MIKANIQNILDTSKTLKVLYVEDNKEVRESTLLMLENFFDYIVIAVDGDNGLKLYQNYFYDTNNYFDIVISDIQVPKLNGVDMVRKIYKINKEQKIIMVSAYSDKEYLIPLLNMGVEGFMQKPLSFEQITNIVKEVCKTFQDKLVTDFGDGYTYNRLSNLLLKDDENIKLNSNEVKLLELFLKNTDKNFTLEDMFNYIFFDEPYKEFSTNSIRALLKRFRKKLPGNLIINNRTFGYRINLPQ